MGATFTFLILELIPFMTSNERISIVMTPQFTRLAAPIVGAALACLLALSGCSGTSPAPSSPASSPQSAAPATPAAPSKVLLVVSFGTSYNDNRDLSIGGIENAIKTAYPDYEVRRAFTSQIIIDKLASRDNLHIDNVQQAMDRLVADGVKDLVIQPTTIMAGYEYTDLVTAATAYQGKFDSFAIGSPLLTSENDYKAVAKAITANTAKYVADDTAVIFMGHGTSAPSNANYAKLAGVLKSEGYKNYFIGTVEGTPTMKDAIKDATKAKVKKVVLQPLMVVAGDHANNDMAGDDAESWKSAFAKAGFKVTTLIEGLGQNPDIQQIYVAHAKDAIAQAAANPNKGGGSAASAPSSPNVPVVAAHQIKKGAYPINVTTGSSMFKVVDAQLDVEGEKMAVKVTLSGHGYGRLSLGTAEQAAQAADGFIDFKTDSQGRHVYVIPISRLNQPMSIAAESGKTAGKWYNQTITFLSDKIPAGDIKSE